MINHKYNTVRNWNYNDLGYKTEREKKQALKWWIEDTCKHCKHFSPMTKDVFENIFIVWYCCYFGYFLVLLLFWVFFACFAAKEGDELKDTAIEATTRLKQALMNEREAKLRLQNDVEKLKEHIIEINRQLKVAKETEESLKGSLRALEEVTAKMERDQLQKQTHEVRVVSMGDRDCSVHVQFASNRKLSYSGPRIQHTKKFTF